MLSGEHYFNWLEIDGTVSMSNTYNYTPYSPSVSFSDPYVFKDTLRLIKELGDITDKLDYLKNNYTDATMARMDWELDSAINKNITAVLNFKANFKISSQVTGFVKFGGKLQFDTRDKVHSPYYQRYDYNNEQLFTQQKWMEMTGEKLQVAPNKRIMITNFDVQDKATPFWNGEYNVWPYFPESILRNWYDNMSENRRDNVDELHLGYQVEERLYATYIMSKFNVAKWLSLVGGVRYEYSDNYYLGKYSTISGSGNNITGVVKDTTSTPVHTLR
jgi:hypothetical protein